MLELLWLFAGLLIGGISAWFIAYYRLKSEVRSNDTALGVYDQRIRDLNQEIEFQKEEVKRERDKVITLSNRLAGSQSEFRFMEERLEEQRKEIENIQNKFYAEFKNLANQIFEEKSRKFTDLNKVNLESLLKPLGERIQQFEKKVETSNQSSLEWNAALREQISSLKDLNLHRACRRILTLPEVERKA